MIRAAVILAFGALPAHAESFVALAMDQNAGVHAFAKADTAHDAQSKAIQECGSLAGECKVITTRMNMCVSLAYDYSNGGFGVFTADTAEVAEREALPHCASYGNRNCQAVETACGN